MSNYINNTTLRRESLLELATGILQGKRQAEFVRQFDEVIEAVTPRDVVYVVDGMVKTGAEIEVLKKAVSQVLNLMYQVLMAGERNMWENCLFLNAMVLENQQMEIRMKALKQLVKTINVKGIEEEQLQFLKSEIRKKLNQLREFENHYIRKENLLFPYLEKAWSDFRCLQVMWSLHDDVRVGLKLLDELLGKEDMNMEEFNYAIGTLYFSIYPLQYREEAILFPVAYEELPKEAWNEMLEQSAEIGYAYIDFPEMELKGGRSAGYVKNNKKHGETGIFDLGTGSVNLEQIIGIFDHLPVNLTFVNENDEVCYFNNTKDRHFPRSLAIIGRKVQNCHPPESLEVVNRIVESFRTGEKDSESFWIQMKEMFIHIRYFAIRDAGGTYRGTLEVSQDITAIKKLEGEKRLLDEEPDTRINALK